LLSEEFHIVPSAAVAELSELAKVVISPRRSYSIARRRRI
jgi:hypothetical protein